MTTVEETSPTARSPLSFNLQLATIGASVALVLALYWASFSEMVPIWLVDPNYTHGFLVPLASLLIAFKICREKTSPFSSTVTVAEWLWGMGLLVAGFSMHLVSWFLGNWFLDVVSLIAVLLGLLMASGGWKVARAYRFPILFLLFMAPLPIAWYQPVAIAMQQLAANLSCFMLETCGVPAFQEGHMIFLPDYSLEVGAACAGLRQVTALLAGAVLLGYMMRRSSLFCWILAGSSLLIAILANALRIVLIGTVMMLFGERWAEGVFHTMEGLFVTIFAALMILYFAKLMAHWQDRFMSKRALASEGAGR